MNQQDLEKMVKDIIVNMGGGSSSASTYSAPSAPSSYYAVDSGKKFTAADYPLGEKSRDKLKTPTGKSINDVTLEAVLNGTVTAQDVRITPQTLEMQAQISESVGRTVFAQNLRRASELIAVSDERILQIYDKLRPFRATKSELMAIADELDQKYGAKTTAALVREAAEVGEARGKLKKA